MNSRILIWDIESSDLRADWATLLCVGYKWFGEDKTHVISITDFDNWKDDLTDDRKVVEAFHKVMSEADMLVTFYGKGFDLKFMYSKFLKHGLPVLANIPHVDLYYIAKSNLNLSRKSLDNISKYLNLSSKKYHVEGEIWHKARVGHEPSLKKVVQHCAADIKVTEELYLKLRPLVRRHPRIKDWDSCRNCGSDHLQRRGYALTTTLGRRIRVQCMDCGGWENRSEQHAEAVPE